MTIKELFVAMPGKPQIHRGQVFFNTRDIHVAAEWKKKGARVEEWYDGQPRAAPPRTCDQGYEVHVLGAITTRVTELDEDGDEVDITREVLLAEARERQ